MAAWLALACADCPTGLAARAWALSGEAWPLLALVMMPLGLTLGAAAVVYGLFGEEQ